ncbi:MAG: peptidase C11 [Clostridiales bacterium]|nr:peptidase C11 [Clostridiales bacterium]
MNNTPNSGGRKKKVTEGNGNVNKREEAQTTGPVGREDGYAGRNDNDKKGDDNDAERAGGLDMLGALLGGGSGSSGNSGNAAGNIIGSLLGGSSSSGNSGNSGSSGNSGNAAGSIVGSLLGAAAGGAGKKGGLGLKKIIIIAVLIIAALLIYKSCSGGQGCSLMSMMSGVGQSVAFEPEEDINEYSASDLSAPAAPVSLTSTSNADLTVASGARDKRTVIKGDGTDEVLIMLFMCGTDLESKYGMATNDLNEILKGSIDDERVHIIVETGGTKQWRNSIFSNETNQRYLLTSKGVAALDKNVGNRAMTDPNTLSDFIRFCVGKFPNANRRILIFWDHGGGSLSGYGYDQLHTNKGSMTLDKINKALRDGGTTFDFIGFDACLMATMETALVTEQYADYLIASEETEPGCGWFYTNWITAISRNPAISTVELGKMIVDDFNSVCAKNNAGDTTTLSVVDLAEFAGTVPDAFAKFSENISELLDSKQYQVVANARSNAREFGASSGINHVDLIHLASGIGTNPAKNLIKALQGCIKYNRTARAMTNSYGLSIYFPFTSFKSVSSAVNLYNNIGMDARYSACLKSFASLAAGGQIATGTTSSPMGSLFGNLTGTQSSSSSSDVLSSLLGGALGGDSSGIAGSLLSSLLGGDRSWFESDRVMANLDYYDAHAIYADDMLLTEKDGGSVLSMSSEKWEMVETVQLNVFLDDGEGYIDLGMDNVYEFDGDGDLKIDFDRTWIALNGQVVPYYMISDVTDGDNRVITGRVPAILVPKDEGEEDRLVYVIIVFDDSDPSTEYGFVAGARGIYENYETDTLGRGLIKLKEGDKLQFVCDYYKYDGTYAESHFFGDDLIVHLNADGTPDIEVSNVSIGSGPCKVSYCLTDMYGNEFWTMSKDF